MPLDEEANKKRLKKLEAMRKRMFKLQAKDAKLYFEIMNSGRDPWAGIRKERKLAATSLQSIIQDQKQLLSTTHPQLQRELSQKIYTAIQLIGQHLADATPQESGRTLTAKQIKQTIAAQQKFNTLNERPQPGTASLELLTPEATYALLGMKTPITFTAPPGASIYLSGLTGGVFENDLAAQHLIADKNGNATTTWRSLGYSIGPSTIHAISPQCANDQQIQVQVVTLRIKYLPSLQEIQKAVSAKINSK